LQLEHLASYEAVRERVAAGTLRLHGWWFDIASGSMYSYDRSSGRFELIDRRMVKTMLKQRVATAPEVTH
jgi:carbonic anhydrase